MTTKDIKYLNLELIDEQDIGQVVFRLYENRIFHGIIKQGQKISLEMAKKGCVFLDKNGGGRFYNIYEFENFAEMDPEVRAWASDTSGNLYTHIDAVVINNFAQKMIANFYLKFNKPKKPTKIFNSSEKALEWIQGYIKENIVN